MEDYEQTPIKMLIIIVVVIIIIGLILYGIVSVLFPFEEDEDPPVIIELKANAGDDQSSFTSMEVWFDGGNSTGDIVKYSWDFDRGDGLSEDATGSIVSHAFTEYGDYRVTLTVSDPDGKTSKDFLYVHVSYCQVDQGTVYPSQGINETFPIDEGVKRLHAILEYPSLSQSGLISNELDLTIWDSNDDPVASTTDQERDSGSTQTEEIDITDYRELTPPGEWNAEIFCWTGGVQGVSYTLTIEVYY